MPTGHRPLTTDHFPSAPCRLLIDSPAAGAWNMAVDEVLLEEAADNGRLCWRFYGWREPTLSLGYFQVYDDRWRHAASKECPSVRRPSGGGAIVHDIELTYSFAFPEKSGLTRRRHDLYEAVHRTLIEVLRDWAISAQLCGPVPPRAIDTTPQDMQPVKPCFPPAAWCGERRRLFDPLDATGQESEIGPCSAGFRGSPMSNRTDWAVEVAEKDSKSLPFLCFQRRSPGDVLVGPVKIAGSAQRRLRGAVLQHGSVLLGRSLAAPELAGLREVTGVRLRPAELAAAWACRLAEQWRWSWYEESFSATERLRAESLLAGKYADDRWTRHRGRPLPADLL